MHTPRLLHRILRGLSRVSIKEVVVGQNSNLDQHDFLETRELVTSAFRLARVLSIRSVLVQADEITDRLLVANLRTTERVIWIARDSNDIPVSDPTKDVVML